MALDPSTSTDNALCCPASPDSGHASANAIVTAHKHRAGHTAGL